MKPYYEADGVAIYHGDALDVIPRLSLEVDAVVTDPPYSSGGAFRGDRMQNTVAKYVSTGTLAYRPEFAGDNRDQRAFFAWSSLWLAALCNAGNAGCACAVFTDWRQLPTTTDAVQAAGFIWRGIGTWNKGLGTRPRANGLRAQSEFVVWGTRGAVREDDPVYLPGVFDIGSVGTDEKEHIAEKPADLLRQLVQLAPKGGLVVDPFMGSGSTLVAARDMGRRAVGIEVEERFCELAARKLAQAILPL